MHLGINSPSNDAVQVRRVTTCSPVAVGEYTFKRIDDNGLVIFLKAGSYEDVAGKTFLFTLDKGDGYVETANRTAFYTPDAPPGIQTQWDPIPTFRRSDAEVSMFAVRQRLAEYFAPVFDPLFMANGTQNFTLNGLTLFMADHLFNAMACIDQVQFCPVLQPQ
jgi:hypothetical protein